MSRQSSVMGIFISVISVVMILIAAPNASAQQVFAYPKAGQSQEQQARDQAECHQWAVGQTGYDPSRPPPPPIGGYAPPPPPPSSSGGILGLGDGGMFGGGGLLGDAATGAALGAAGGALAGSAGKGAAIGSLGGALIGGVRRQSRENERAQWEAQRQQQMAMQQQQAAQAQQQGRQSYTRAFSACMTGRNYQIQ